MAGVEDVGDVDRINSAIFFGPYGSGKTWLGASADLIEDYSPVLIVDIEGSAAGVKRGYPGVKRISADSHEKLEIIKNELLTKEHPYKTVIFDTLNVAQERAEKWFEARNPGNKFGKWADLKDWTVDFLRSMHHAPFLAIFIAHPQVDKDENTGKITTTVSIAGKAREIAPTVPDLIGYIGFEATEEGPQRVLVVGKDSSFITKNRFGLPNKLYGSTLEGPTMADIQMAIIAAAEDK